MPLCCSLILLTYIHGAMLYALVCLKFITAAVKSGVVLANLLHEYLFFLRRIHSGVTDLAK